MRVCVCFIRDGGPERQRACARRYSLTRRPTPRTWSATQRTSATPSRHSHRTGDLSAHSAAILARPPSLVSASSPTEAQGAGPARTRRGCAKAFRCSATRLTSGSSFSARTSPAGRPTAPCECSNSPQLRGASASKMLIWCATASGSSSPARSRSVAPTARRSHSSATPPSGSAAAARSGRRQRS